MAWGMGRQARGAGEFPGEGAPGTNSWWNAHARRCDARGAGISGRVILDGTGFMLEGAGKLPPGMTIDPGGAPGAWYQTDPWSFTGYPAGMDSMY